MNAEPRSKPQPRTHASLTRVDAVTECLCESGARTRKKPVRSVIDMYLTSASLVPAFCAPQGAIHDHAYIVYSSRVLGFSHRSDT
eukprot:7388759-Prymnesium_polylepis.2